MRTCSIIVSMILLSTIVAPELHAQEVSTIEEYFASLRLASAPVLIQTLKVQEAFKIYAVKALGNMKEKQAVDALVEVFQAEEVKRVPSWELRAEVAIALGKIGDQKAIPFLGNTVRTEQDWVVRRYIAGALGKIGGEKSIEVLISLLETDENDSVCNEAARALGNIGDKKSFDVLLYTYQRNKAAFVRETAFEALKKLKW